MNNIEKIGVSLIGMLTICATAIPIVSWVYTGAPKNLEGFMFCALTHVTAIATWVVFFSTVRGARK